MWTWVLAWPASVAGPKDRTPPALIDQPGLELAASIDQPRPALVGRVSATVTAKALPSPVLVTSMTNPMPSPALTVALSAVLVMTVAGHRTVMSPPAVFGNRSSETSFAAQT